MSKGSLFWGNAVGKLGENVFYRANGQQRNRTYVHEVRNPKTRSQMRQRIKWANVINTWRMLKPFITMGMQNRKTTQSDYNKFVSLNVGQSTAYLLKEEARLGGTLVAPYIITLGTLGVRSMSSAVVTDINVGNINLATASIGELSAAIIANNQGISVGDQITVLALGQSLVEGIPQVLPYAYKFVVTDASIDNPALDAIEVSGSINPTVEEGFLAYEFVGVEYSTYGGAIIHSRIGSDGILAVSNSRIAVAYDVDGTQQSVNPFASTEDEALASYGFKEPVFLSPASAGVLTPVPKSVITGVLQDGASVENGSTIELPPNLSALFSITGQNFDVSRLSVTVGDAPVEVTIESATSAKFSIPSAANNVAVVVSSASNNWSFTVVRD